MADPVDVTNVRIQEEENTLINHIRKAAADIPEGEPGECYECGEYYIRLVHGACAGCRDLLGLP